MMASYKGLRKPIKWAGGKSKVAKDINELIKSVKHKIYVEPFAGGATSYFKKKPSEVEVLNDIKTPLMRFYSQLKNDGEELLQCDMTPDKEKFERCKERVHNNEGSLCDFLYVNKNSYSGMLKNYAPDRKSCVEDSCKYRNINTLVNNFDKYKERMKNTILTNNDYRKILKETDSPDTFFYIDSPYENRGKLYDVPDAPIAPEVISHEVSKLKGKAIVSFNDSPRVRRAFPKERGFHTIPFSFDYQLQQGSRTKGNELLITNFPTKCKWDGKNIRCDGNKK